MERDGNCNYHVETQDDSWALIFNSCFHFQPKETKRWGEKVTLYLDQGRMAKEGRFGSLSDKQSDFSYFFPG